MRKLISGILAIAIVLCMSVPALAADFTPIYEWTEEEWEYAMENWTEEDCYYYVEWEYSQDWDAYYEYYEKLYATMEEWTDEQLEFYYYIQDAYYSYYSTMWIEQQKEAYGFPYMDGLNVQVNGKFLTFSGPRAVVNTAGVTMIPAGDIADALDAGCSYNADGTATITLRGKSVSFTAGQDIAINTGYEWDYTTYEYVEKVTTAAPYLEGGVLMIPLRAVCNEYNCTLLWSQSYKVAIVLDRDAIVADINKDFAIINRFLSAVTQGGAPSSAEPTETRLSASLEGMLYGEEENLSAKMTADMTLVVNGADMLMELDLATDAENLINLIKLVSGSGYSYYYGDDYYDSIAEILTNYADGQHSIIFKGDAGEVYIKSPLYALSAPLAEGKWIRSTADSENSDGLDAIYPFGMIQELLDSYGAGTVGDYIYDNMYSSTYSYYYSYSDPYNSIMNEAATAAAFVGDSRFTKNGSTYTLYGDEKSVFEAVTAAGLYDEDYPEYFAYNYGISGLEYSFSFTESDGAVSEYSLDISLPSSYGTLTILAEYAESRLEMKVAFVGSILGKIIFEMDIVTSPTTRTVDAPPTDEVIDESELIGTQSYPEEEDWAYYGWTDSAYA